MAEYEEENSFITQEFDEAYAERIIIERSDMVVASTQRIATRYVDENEDVLWKQKYLQKNAAGEVVAIITPEPTPEPPSWVPEPLIQ